MGFLSGKKILVTGVLSDRSIASGIAEALIREGAEIALTYQNEAIRSRVEDIAKTLGVNILIQCDVGSDDEIAKTFESLKKHWNTFDGFVHSIGFAPRDQLEGDFVEKTSREGFKIAHDISSYSFTALARAALPMLNPNSSLLTLTYLGSEKAMPSYNVMGLAKASLEANVRYMAASLGPKKIRVNAISAGPIKTLAASGVSGLRKMLAHNAQVSPLRENVTIEQVGNTAAFLCSDLSSGITAEIIHVDAGFHAIAMGELV